MAYKQTISKTKSNAADIKIKIKNLQGDINYKDFNLTNLLLNGTKMTVNVEQKNADGETIKSKKFQETINNQSFMKNIKWKYVFSDNVSSTNCPLEIKNVSFNFASRTSYYKQKFRAIDDYSEKLVALEKDLNRLKGFDIHNKNDVQNQIAFMKKVEKELPKWERESFENVPFSAQNPNHYAEILNELTSVYNRHLEQLPQEYYLSLIHI